MSQKFEKLKKILKELFQLDHPDLDFGLYRIMHAKAAEVTAFLEKELLPQVKAEFGQYKTADKAELQKELDKVVAGLNAAEVDPETSPKVKELRAKLANDSVDIASLENDVYDHLLSFFSRYYSEGDFVSKRRYSKEGKYAIPYDGEEVKLYWANHDQYYIKTSEYLRGYAFRLRPDDDAKPMRVHFRLADVAEGEHGNVKAAVGKDRVFILAATKPVFLEADELICRFEYRPATLTDWPEDVRSGKTKPPAQKELTVIAEARILATNCENLRLWVAELAKTHVKSDGEKAEYNRLRAHLNRYVGRNTFDYFIHKDLGGFLKRELDFFIKNEVMMLDDIENESAARVEQYLSRIKIIRRIAGKIIDFLAQLEDFQKALWLKKKFIVETQYCVALNEIPNEFLPEIVANANQWEEWESLHLLSKLKQDEEDLLTEKVNLKSPEFLKANPSLMVDTRHFDRSFTASLLEAIGSIDDKTDYLLFHSENLQALNLIQSRYQSKVNCVYVDPPYNTGSDGFCYRDSYQHSSWLSMIYDRFSLAWRTSKNEGRFFCSIDDRECDRLLLLMKQIFLDGTFLGAITWEKRTKSQNTETSRKMLQSKIEYVLPFSKSKLRQEFNLISVGEKEYPEEDSIGKYRLERMEEMSATGIRGRQSMIYPILGVSPREGKQWQLGEEYITTKISKDEVRIIQGVPYVLIRPQEEDNEKYKPFWSHFFDKETYGTTESGFEVVDKQLGFGKEFATVKPVALLQKLFFHSTLANDVVLDFFAGSGTTGHAILNLNREDGGRRKVILVEMANYFDTVLVPRLKKVAFTPEWKDGQPKRLATGQEVERGPRVFKIVRLESYEDTLNNLKLKRSPDQQSLLDAAEARGADKLREKYLLQYLLKVETRESQSLLNIAAFTDPTAYKLVVKRPGSDESREVNVDLLETFNWLLGLTVEHIAIPQVFSAKFERDSEKRLQLNGRLKPDAAAPYWFRTVTGTMPDGRKALVIWRKLTGTPEEDNLVLDEWFKKAGYSSKDTEFGLIYVNGGNNLENLRTPDDTWKVRLIEDDFQRLMFAGDEV
jgi:adenine-specific DNA-methyltransferase